MLHTLSAVAPPALVAVGVVALVAALVSAGRGRRAAFRAGPDQVPDDAGDAVARPSVAYHAGVAAVIVGIGFELALAWGLVLAVVMAIALVRMWRAAGVELAGNDLIFGTGPGRAGVPLSAIGGVVVRPRSWIGRAPGTFGIADDEGEWLAAIRWQSAPQAARVVASAIARRGLVADGAGVWRDPTAPLPSRPIPSLGI